jgi:plasmid maintenance system antidote protein VapI
MTGNELSEVLATIGWTAGELQRRLGIRGDTVRQWLSGRRPIPDNVATWLIRLRDKISDDPLPEGWVP